jgi:Ca-activated chloride channel family protein
MAGSTRQLNIRLIAGAVWLLFTCSVFAQPDHIQVRPILPPGPPDPILIRPLAPNIIIPYRRPRSFAPDRPGQVEITQISVRIDIIESAATTTVEVGLRSNSRFRQEAELMMPVPDGAVIRGFAYDGPGGQQITAEVLPKEEARKMYQQLVSKIRDPGMVEFVGCNLVRSSVFPVEPASSQKVRLTYEHLLDVDGKRVDYLLPRTESLEDTIPINVTADIKAKHPISTVYSASHKLYTQRISATEITVTIAPEAVREPGPFRLSYLTEDGGLTASIFAYPEQKVGGGYFLLLAGLPVEAITAETPVMKREVTLVLDRSGSMRSEKLKQVKEAALQIISGLDKGEAFNVLIYSNNVESFSKKPVIKNNRTEQAVKSYIDGITAIGGTNIYDALKYALDQEPTAGMLPIVLFLTDGLPTVGRLSETEIRELAAKSNPHKRRVFTFGVGLDVNAPLLEAIADETRARAEFVLPQEDVEVKVGKVFKQLTGPILADGRIEVLQQNGEPALGRTRDMIPAKLLDLFEGDRLILLGQYIGKDPIVFEISGNYLGKERKFRFTFEFDKATLENGFVPRLWACRKIAQMIGAIRQMGANSAVSSYDPKVKELVDEIVRLSTDFGILTEYTAFLAREGTNFQNRARIMDDAATALSRDAMGIRTGAGGISQSLNIIGQKNRTTLNYGNSYLNERMERVSIANVQQINDMAFYRKGEGWIDSSLLAGDGQIRPDRIIEYGSPEYFELAEQLAREGRQGVLSLPGDVMIRAGAAGAARGGMGGGRGGFGGGAIMIRNK